MHLGDARLACKRGELPLRPAAPEHEQPAEPLVQIGQALEHELRPRSRRMAPLEQPVVEAEHRHDALAPFEGSAQCRMVVHAQVARQPDECGRSRSHWLRAARTAPAAPRAPAAATVPGFDFEGSFPPSAISVAVASIHSAA
jgi:hypothetical protein